MFSAAPNRSDRVNDVLSGQAISRRDLRLTGGTAEERAACEAEARQAAEAEVARLREELSRRPPA